MHSSPSYRQEGSVRVPPIGQRTSVWKGIDVVQPVARREMDWKVVVEQIRAGDPAGAETLYRNLAAGARLFLRRRLGTQDVEDRIHDLFIIVVETIQRGELREPERLMGFVRTVLYRQLNLEISRIVDARRTSVELTSNTRLIAAEPTPEEQAADREKVELMKQVLRKMTEREFEVLTRFYLHEETPERIRKE